MDFCNADGSTESTNGDSGGRCAPSKDLDRRGFLRGAIATGAAALAVGTLGGCSSGAPSGDAAKKLAPPMNEEERAAAVADSTYMGGSVDYYGQAREEVTLPSGQITSQYVLDYLKYAKQEAFEKVRDRVYVSHAYPLCNAAMIEGDTGMIIIETSGSVENAQKDYEAFKQVCDKPVSAIILSHDHYCCGTTAYIPEDNPDNIPVIMHEDVVDTIARTIGPIAPTYALRARMQFGAMLPSEGPDAPWAASYAGGGKDTVTFVPPTVVIPKTPSMTEMVVDGLTFRFYPGHSDSPATMNIYCVELDTLYSNHIWACYFNIYTLRGEKYRDPELMLPELDTIRALHPEYLIPGTGPVLSGREVIDEEVTLYRDAIQFVLDQTLRFMNKGYTPDEIVKAVKVPAEMVQGRFTHAIYGEVEHFVRGVYDGLLGWFDGDTVKLHPVTREFEYGRLTAALGGDDAVAGAAQAALDDRQYSWAATLATYVLANSPEHEGAKKAKAEALRKMGHMAQASIPRSFYMSECYEIEGGAEEGVTTAFGDMTKERLKAMPRTLVLDKIRVTLDPEKADGVKQGLAITFTDEDITNSLVVRNHVAAVEEGKAALVNLELKMDYPTWMSIAVGEKKLEDCLGDESASLEGDDAALDAFLGMFEMAL